MKSIQNEEGNVTRMQDPVDPRMDRLRRLAWLLDRSISIGGFRFGLDPLIGLLPGAGDAIGAGLSTWILYQAARLGIPVQVLLKMIGNVLVDLIVGAIPLAGDLFDFGWRANVRNLRLVERHYDPIRRERPLSRIVWAIMTLMIVSIMVGIGLMVLLLRAVWEAIDRAGA